MNALVKIVEGHAMADSRDIAVTFEKVHRNLLRSIRTAVEQRPDLALNFERMIAKVDIGKGAQRDSTYYLMDDRGFYAIAGGFTGPKGLDLRLAVFDEYRRVKAALEGAVRPQPLPTAPDPNGIAHLVEATAKHLGPASVPAMLEPYGFALPAHAPHLTWGSLVLNRFSMSQLAAAVRRMPRIFSGDELASFMNLPRLSPNDWEELACALRMLGYEREDQSRFGRPMLMFRESVI